MNNPVLLNYMAVTFMKINCQSTACIRQYDNNCPKHSSTSLYVTFHMKVYLFIPLFSTPLPQFV